MRRVLMVGAAGAPALLAVLLGLGMALQWREQSEPDEWARFAESPQVDGLAIVVEREHPRVRPGRETRYTVAVGNRSQTAEVVTVRVTVPPWLTPAEISDGEVGDGFVEWPLVVAPGTVATTEISGVYAAPRPGGDAQSQPGGGAQSQPGGGAQSQPGGGAQSQPGGDPEGSAGAGRENGDGPAPVIGAPQRVTLTACALDRVDGHPIVCATDATHLRSAGRWSGWWLAGGVGTLAVAATVAAVTLVRHRRPVPDVPARS